MVEKKSFTDRFIERVDAIDGGSLQAYLLRLSKDKGFFATILNAVNDGILVIDRTLRIRYHNKAARDLLGLPADLTKVRLSHFIRSVDWKQVLQLDVDEWTRLLREELEISYPTHRFLRLYLVPQELNGESCAIAILHDVTEERRKTSDELSASTAEAVSLLAAGVAHEIGNPLNSLYLNLQLIEQDIAGIAGMSETAAMVKSCVGEVERLDNIIHQFLHAVRPGRPRLAPLNLTAVVMETLNFMRQEFELKRISVGFNAPEHVPEIMGDAAQLKQAFYNILKNSLQAMSEGGSVDIAFSYDEKFLIVVFSDSGSGVTSEQLNEMFEPFKTFKSEGTGLGMMIIQRIFKEHGALFGVSSATGRGLSFQIKFPRSDRRSNFAQLPERTEKDA